MKRPAIVDLFGWTAILLWIVTSVYFAIIGNGDMFQRAGTLGIAAGVGYFAAVPWPLPHPPSGLEQNAVHLAQVLGLKQGIEVADNNLGLVARSIRLADEQSGRFPSSTILALSEVPLQDLSKFENRIRDQNDEIERLLQDSLAADRSVSAIGRSGVKLQATIVILATLQTGFGSLLFSTACSGVIVC